MKRAVIISTGNELLYGKTVDTNSAYISSRFFPLSLDVRMFMVTGDDADDLAQAVRLALSEADIVIMSGGLGPTDDDKTIEALRRIFGFAVAVHGPSLRRMDDFFRKAGMPMTDMDRKMAEVPEGALVLTNEKGLAPGFVIRHDDKVLIALPGVPAEMTDLVDRSVIPYLIQECGIVLRNAVSFKVIGMKESEINALVRAMDLPFGRLEWGMTAKEGSTTVTFVSKDGTGVSDIPAKAEQSFGERYLAPEWERPEEEVIHLLRKRGMKLALAESCTGGLISKRITDIAGSSDVFVGSVVAYANSVKASFLDVSRDDLDRHGAVSPEVAEAMAVGARQRLGADIGISTTGIAGPGGGTETKPVGTVWFGFADIKGAGSFSRLIPGDRERVRKRATMVVIENLRTYLKQMAD